jgi:hypothetical protein
MEPSQEQRRSRRWSSRDLVLGLCVFFAGIAMATWLNWPALQSYGIYKEDLVQSPHWAAYHQTSFQPDDLIILYASFNESPLQNAIYWVGTWFVEVVRLSKVLSVVSYGFLALVSFVIGRAMYGARFGVLLALFITFFPDQWDFSAGFFSKFWAIPLLLTCVYLLETERFRGLIALLPFAAIAYPSSAVLIGMTATAYWVQELHSRGGKAGRLFRNLAIGSVLAVALLLLKYAPPPEAIGTMRPGSELRLMPEVRSGGYPSHYIPVPTLASELIRYVEHPFVLSSAVLFFLVLGRRGVGWDRSWTALFLASAIGYLLADYFFMRFYIPNRYTRYSMALILALWHARNWDLILARVNWRFARTVAAAALLVVAGYAYGATFESGRGRTDRSRISELGRFIREELPEGILVAGSPRRLDDVMLQGKRSVLAPYKLAHPWFTVYYDEMRERTQATLRAHFARTREPINALHRRYGATHFLVEKWLFRAARADRRLFAEPFNQEVYEELGARRTFFLSPPPRGLFLWEDDDYGLIELPIPSEFSILEKAP